MSAYDNDWRVTNLSDEDSAQFIIDDGNGRPGRVERSAPFHWAASWAGERPRYHESRDEAIRWLIGDPR
jgi:hypothetical protein